MAMEIYNEGRSVKNQYIAAIVMNIMTVCYGCALGWVSPSLPILSGPDSPMDVPLTVAEGSLVASIICIGGLISTPFYGWISDRYGRKTAALTSAVPYAISWILKLSWTTSTGLLIARFAIGFGGGGAFFLAPTYCVEIASVNTRGALGSLMVFSINIGIVLMYIMGAFISFKYVLIIMIIVPILFFILMLRMPETPVFLVKQKRDDEAVKAIAWLRGEPLNSPVVERVLLSLKYDVDLANKCSGPTEDTSTEKITPSNENVGDMSPWKFFFTSAPTFKAFLVCFALLTVQCFTGMFAVITFANDIFKQAGSSMSPNTNTIIVGFIQLMGSIVGSSLIEKLGRKVLLIGSCGIVSLSMLTIGTYFFMREMGNDVSNIGWIPVCALSFAVSTFAMGIGPVPYLLPSETIMVQGRSVAITIMYIWVWICSFLIGQFFNYFCDILGIHVVFWGFAFIGACGVLITIFFLPETKGRSLETLIAYYSGEKISKKAIGDENGELL